MECRVNDEEIKDVFDGVKGERDPVRIYEAIVAAQNNQKGFIPPPPPSPLHLRPEKTQQPPLFSPLSDASKSTSSGTLRELQDPKSSEAIPLPSTPSPLPEIPAILSPLKDDTQSAASGSIQTTQHEVDLTCGGHSEINLCEDAHPTTSTSPQSRPPTVEASLHEKSLSEAFVTTQKIRQEAYLNSTASRKLDTANSLSPPSQSLQPQLQTEMSSSANELQASASESIQTPDHGADSTSAARSGGDCHSCKGLKEKLAVLQNSILNADESSAVSAEEVGRLRLELAKAKEDCVQDERLRAENERLLDVVYVLKQELDHEPLAPEILRELQSTKEQLAVLMAERDELAANLRTLEKREHMRSFSSKNSGFGLWKR